MKGTLREVLAAVFAIAGTGWARAEELRGEDSWGGLRHHLAVVNSADAEPSPWRMSLAGEWDFICRDKGRVAPSPDTPNRISHWPEWCEPQLSDAGTPWTIRVPGCWEQQDVGGVTTSRPWRCWWDSCAREIRGFHGQCWYHRTVTLPESWRGKRVWLKVGGVNSAAWIFVNARPAAMVPGSCGTRKYDITDRLAPDGRVEITAEISNIEPSRRGCQNYIQRWGGFLRDVELEATPEVFIDDAWVRGDFDRHMAEVHVTIEGKMEEGEGRRLRVTIEGETVEQAIERSQAILKVPLRNLKAWSPEHPYVYKATIELLEKDVVTMSRVERFGVRKLEAVGREFYLNGKPFYFRAAGWHCIDPVNGVEPPDRELFRSRIRKIKDAGFNAVRFHTHCKWPECFEAADEEGLLIQAELPYYKDWPSDPFAFDPIGDANELWENYRRHPSFAVYSGGNEGNFGSILSKSLYEHIRKMDPDRLVLGQDGTRLHFSNLPGTSDFVIGVATEWPRGSINPDRPFISHEYLNLTVKLDSRLEDRFTGVWLPPVTRKGRETWLAGFGLDLGMGDRLQDAQHSLQGYWQKHGIETARADPYCDGYSYWSLQDACGPQAGVATAQGLFNPFWEEKSGGMTAAGFRRFNGPSCVLLDLNRGFYWRDPMPERNGRHQFPCETNWVYVSGETIPAKFLFQHYGDCPFADAQLDWRLVSSDGKCLAKGRSPIGAQALGPTRQVAAADIVVPDLEKACRATLEAEVSSGDEKTGNRWDFWLFPAGGPTRADVLATAKTCGVTVAAANSAEAERAVAAGGKVVTLANQTGPMNAFLGWWLIGTQVGMVVNEHPALKYLPRETVLTPLLFRIVKEGLPLPLAGVSQKDLIVIGEGRDACYAYLAERRHPNGARELLVAGLDLTTETPEGVAILRGLVEHLASSGK